MKRCSKCDIFKPLDAFNRNRTKKDGRQSTCRYCDNGTSIAHYRNNKQDYFARRAATRKELQAIATSAKDVQCMDCGNRYPPVVMDFDHRDPKDKLDNVARFVEKGNKTALLAEIAKCDVVCANCHRIRTSSMKRFRSTHTQ